jgi:hypothetical protein
LSGSRPTAKKLNLGAASGWGQTGGERVHFQATSILNPLSRVGDRVASKPHFTKPGTARIVAVHPAGAVSGRTMAAHRENPLHAAQAQLK